MSDVVTLSRNGSVAIVTINNPPVNAIGQAVRKGVWDAVDAVAADATFTSAILACAGRTFIAGADIREFDGGAMEPWLPELVEHIHASRVPWVAALFGAVLGGGLETALGCHYRVALASTKIGLPEVGLGILPGAGGTQRTPRITGAAAAIELVTSGRPISAVKACEMGLVDDILPDLEDTLIEYARNIATQPIPRLSSQAGQTTLRDADWDQLRAQVVKAARGQISPLRAFDVVRKAFETDLADGMRLERDAFLELKETDQSKALRHAFFAERAVAKPAVITGGTARNIEQIAVIGGGLMGSGIATSAVSAGYAVTLVEQTEDAAAAGKARIASNLVSAVKRGLMSEAQAQETLDRVTPSADYADTKHADLVIEAVFEEADVKRAVFAELAKHVGPDTILATNTSYLDPLSFTGDIPHPERIMGLHFFSPAHIMKLVEVVQTPKTSADVVATGFVLAKKMRKIAVLSGVCDGFIGNRILAAYGRMAGYLLEDGASPQQIDTAMKQFGMPMGPFEMFDMAGLQIGYANRKRQAASRDPNQRDSRIPDLIVENGWLGQKTGQGYYRYDPNQRGAIPSDDVSTLIEAERARLGIVPRTFSDDEITSLLHAVQVNEAAMILAEGVAQRPLDIDMVKMMGYGYPRWRGGPMQEADTRGTATVLKTMQNIAAADPSSWTVAPLLTELGMTNTPFAGLNA